MDLLLEHLPTILEFICIAIIAKSLSNQSFAPTIYDIGMLFLVGFLSFIPTQYPIALWSIGLSIYFFYITFSIKKTFWERVNLYILSYGSMILLNFATFTAISILLSPNVWYMPILGNICSIFLAMILFRFTICRRLYDFLCQAKFPYKLLLLDTFVLLVVLLLFFKINTSDFYINIIYWLAIAIILLIANICILYYDRELFKKHQELHSYEKNLPIYQTLIEEIRSNQHEFSNRIEHFRQLPYACKDYDSLSQALLKYSSAYCKPMKNYTLLQIDMPLLAATLYSFSCQAAQKNITLTFNIRAFHLTSSVPEYQLADYVSILTQNAIEASQEGERIYISIDSDQVHFQFEIRNPSSKLVSSSELRQFFQKGYTSKQNERKTNGYPHGYGLYSLHQNITNAGGIIGVECMEHSNKNWIIFRFEI